MNRKIFNVIARKPFILGNRCSIPLFTRHFHTTLKSGALEEFFDDKEKWGASKISVGRPWKRDELRLKSNQDLHKLWYILLKERNMVMTMYSAYEYEREQCPGPDRLEKVEESMEHVLDVISERDRAVNLLETGETGEQGKRWVVDETGRGRWRLNMEHAEPMHENTKWADSDKPTETPWAASYKKMYREKVEAVEQKRKRDIQEVKDFKEKMLPLEERMKD